MMQLDVWVAVDVRLPSHRKVVRTAARLGCERATVVGYLVTLWAWAAEHAPDGVIDDVEASDLEEIVGWRGEAGHLYKCLLGSWIDETEGGVVIHDWHDHAGKLIQRREVERKRSRQRREDDRRNADRGQTAVGPRSDRGRSADRPRQEGEGEVVNPPNPPGGSSKASRNVTDYPAPFEQLWATWPREMRKDKQRTLRVWRTRLGEGYGADRMAAAAGAYLADCRRARRKPKLLATFLGPDLHIVEWAPDQETDRAKAARDALQRRAAELTEFDIWALEDEELRPYFIERFGDRVATRKEG